jgi:VRR-NUC domain
MAVRPSRVAQSALRGARRPRRGARTADPATAALRAITEAELLAWCLDLARLHGWLSYHPRPARTERGWRTAVQGDGAGWPDLVLLHPTRGGMALELKTETGRTTPEQEAWISAFRAAGWHAQVARPRDRDAVRALLAGE